MAPKKNSKYMEIIIKYGPFLAIISGLFTGGYKLFAEPLVEDTARKVAVVVADSVVRAERERSDKNNEKINEHLKIIKNYMKLQDKKLFEKARELEADD